jgi:hypothetical protein
MPVQGDCGCEGEASNSDDDLYALPESHTSPNHGPHVHVHGPSSSPLAIEIEQHLAPPHVPRNSLTMPPLPLLPPLSSRMSRSHAADEDQTKARPDASRRDQKSENRKEIERIKKENEEMEKVMRDYRRRADERDAIESHDRREEESEEREAEKQARKDHERKVRKYRERKEDQRRAEERNSREQDHKRRAERVEAEPKERKAKSDAGYEEIRKGQEDRAESAAKRGAVRVRELPGVSRRNREDFDARQMSGLPWDSHRSQEDFEALQILLGAASLSEATHRERMELEGELQLARDDVMMAQLRLAEVEMAVRQWRDWMDVLRT